MSNSDVTRLINSDEVQSKVRAPIKSRKRSIRKKNPLTNLGALVRLNPYALSLRRSEILAERRRATAKAAKVAGARAKATQDEKNQTATAQREAAISRTHEPQQRENFKRLIHGEAYTAPTTEAGAPKPLKIQAPRAAIKGVFPKSEKKKVKKVKKEKVVEEKKETSSRFVVPAKGIPKAKKEKVVKVKKEKKAEKPKKGEAAKGEDPKKAAGGKDAPKEEAKKGGKGKGK